MGKRKSKNISIHSTKTIYNFNNFNNQKRIIKDALTYAKVKESQYDRGTRMLLSRARNLLEKHKKAKGTENKELRKSITKKVNKVFKSLSKRDYLEYNPLTNRMNKKSIFKFTTINDRVAYETFAKLKIDKESYIPSGNVYNYDTFKNEMERYSNNDRTRGYEQLERYKNDFIHGRYTRWVNGMRRILGIDASVSDDTFKKWVSKYMFGGYSKWRKK